MSKQFHKPILVDDAWFDLQPSEQDASLRLEMAQRSADLLLEHVHDKPTDEAFHRLQDYIDSRGIEELAEMWAHAPQPSTAAALWRIYLVRQYILHDPEEASRIYREGVTHVDSSDQAVAGAAEPTGPEEIITLADAILAGVFRGDLRVALSRAAAFCRISSIGFAHGAESHHVLDPVRAKTVLTRANKFRKIANELQANSELF